MSFDDLLGLEESKPSPISLRRPAGRPAGTKNPRTIEDEQKDEYKLGMKDMHDVVAGVSLTWLSKIFRIDQEKCKQALVKCPVLRTGRNGGNVYDVKTAAGYLVDPISDLGAYLLTIDSKRLPQKLQEGYWNARIKEMKARTMAGELWPTTKVLEVLGDTFKTIKSTVQLWSDSVEEITGEMTPEQRDTMIALSDKLLDEIHKSLIDKAKNQATESWAAEIDAD